MASTQTDTKWLRHAFMLPLDEARTGYGSGSQRRYATSAAYKYTNTTLGGNFAINNPPQFTRYADIRQPGRGRGEEERSQGMGRYYSEAIDDPRQVVHMTFGVPRYNTWTNFFTNFYDRNTAALANTGRTNALFYNMGLFAGYVVSLPLQPIILAATGISRVLEFLSRSEPSKWYYFKPTMHNYWSAVNVIANEMAINVGLVPRVFGEDMENLKDPGQEITKADIKHMHDMFPDLFREDGGVDIMALANRSQRMADYSQLAVKRLREGAQNITQLRERMGQFVSTVPTDPNPKASGREYFYEYLKYADGKKKSGFTESFSQWTDLEGVYSFIRASQRDGSQFATFRVNHNGSVSESFNNTTRESDIAQQLNTKAAEGRSASFNLMGGNVTAGVGEAFDAVQSWVAGVLDTVKLGGLATLAGTAFIDVPKLWDGSTANLPRAEYTIPLPSPYGNKISRYMNLYIPISMILAAALPLSAGRASYTSPFLCQIYHQGRVQCQLGMIDSLTLTRGTGNVGWNAEHDMLGAEITFSVVDMSSLMHIPIKGGFSSGNIAGTAIRAASGVVGEALGGDEGMAMGLALTSGAVWDEQSVFQDYMAVLGSLPVSDSYYIGRRINLNMTRATQSFKTWRSPSNFMSWMLDSGPARMVSGFAQYSDRF